MKRIILITFLLIGLLLIGIGTFVYLPTIIQGLDFSSAEFRRFNLSDHADKNATDTHITSAEVMLPQETRGYILIVPDRDYDRDWNSPGNQTRPGLRFARRLVERNIAVIRYSPPGSGDESIDLTDPERSVQALMDVLVLLKRFRESENLPEAPTSVLAVGEGCLVSVMALQKTESLRIFEPERLILANCAYTGTALTEWAGRVFYNMDLTGAPTEIQEKAAKIWNEHRQNIESGKIPEMDEDAWEDRLEELKEAGLSSDLLALEKTVSHLYRPSNRKWTQKAAQLEFAPLLQSLHVVRPGLDLIQVLGEYDEEVHPEDRTDQENTVRSSDISNYRFVSLEKTDHGFILRDSPPGSPVENMMRRRDPFAEFNPEFLKLLAGPESSD